MRNEKMKRKNGSEGQRWGGGPLYSIYVRVPFVSETGINFFKTPSDIKLNLHVVRLERKQEEKEAKSLETNG
jgi:hypothetical protein